MRLPAAGLACVVMLCLLAAVAGASHQPAKNGCTSSSVPQGDLTSPQFGLQISQQMSFRYWFEVESVAPSNDALLVQYSENNGTSWQTAANLAPGAPAGAQSDRPVSNRSFAPPDWQNGTANLPANTTRVRFRFESSDTLRQGFRGWGIDDVLLSGIISGTNPTTGFEGGLGTWTATGYWHAQQNPQAISVAPGINPELVTFPDAGALPPANGGSWIAWFGEGATGTYCGADFAGAPELSLSPPTANLVTGQTHTVTANAPHAGGVVRFSVSGANSAAGSTAVPAGGSTTFSYTGANFGNDTITAFLDVNSDGLQQPGEPGGMSSVAWRAKTIDDLEDPEPFVDVNVQPVSGDVYVKLPAGTSRAVRAALAGPRPSQTAAPIGFIPLTQAGKIPVGSQLETTHGRVLVESAASRTRGAVQRAQFYFGRFTVLQRRATRPLTDIVLKGGSFRGCPRAKGSDADTSQRRRSRRSRRSRVRRVWGDGRGRFRTRGRYSAATVRGTKWVVEDRCDGTLTRVARRPRSSRVVVRDFVRRRSVTVRAGRSYFAAKR